jgi:CRP-like cAMP-binding protein
MLLQASYQTIERVYFPESGLGSAVAVGKGRGFQAEVALIGREGMTGLAIVHGADRSPLEIFVQIEGRGQEIAAEDLKAAMMRSPKMRDCFLLYAHVFAIQTSYTALANARGKLEDRLARWLLMAQDRIEADEIALTHEFLSLMLGVRRAGVTTALRHFEDKALIATARGIIAIRDRGGLQEAANGLYGAPEAEFERLFGTERRLGKGSPSKALSF